MSLHFQLGVDWEGITPQIALALTVASECYAEEHEDCFVTCLRREGTFEQQGFHSNGRAADLSVRRYRGGESIPRDVMDRIVDRLEARLGRRDGGPFDVVDEREPRPDSPKRTGPHIHIEYQPL